MSGCGTDDITFCSHDKCSQRSCSRHICNRINKNLPYSVADYKDTKICPATYNDITLDEYVVLGGTGISGFSVRIKEMADMRKCGFTFAEIGEKYGISRQRVHQILKARKEL